MILGIFSVPIFTLLHTLASVVGIAAGLVVAGGLVAAIACGGDATQAGAPRSQTAAAGRSPVRRRCP